MSERNWSGNLTYQATTVHRPQSAEALSELLAQSPQIRVLGSRHSFNRIGDAAALVSLDDMPRLFEVDTESMSVTINANMTYGRFAELARPHNLALHNLASLPHISIGGAVATATHGSGTGNGNLATAVRAIEIATSTGEFVSFDRGDEEFAGAVVALGSLGAVTRLTLDVEPAFEVGQRVFDNVTWNTVTSSFDELFTSGYSVSVFTRYDHVEQVWIKSRRDDPLFSSTTAPLLAGARPATVQRHPVLDLPGDSCTTQLGEPGAWSDRLPHFRLDFTPSAGAEIQSEFFVPIDHAGESIEALRSERARFTDVLMVSKIRTIAEDDLWLSPQYGQPTVAFHFTWELDQPGAERAAAAVAEALAPFAPRPHWGKVFPRAMIDSTSIPRLGDFIDLANRLDPRGAFRNDWFIDTLQ